jgi:hypothetical protein
MIAMHHSLPGQNLWAYLMLPFRFVLFMILFCVLYPILVLLVSSFKPKC